MHLFSYAILLIALLLALLASVGARADDTYNFYFQKAPGPVTVNQGAAPAAAAKPGEAPAAGPAVTTAGTNTVVTVAATPDEATRHRFFLVPGYLYTGSDHEPGSYALASGQADKYLGGQFALKGELDLSERLSVTAEAHLLKRAPDLRKVHYSREARTILSAPSGELLAHDPPTGKVFDFAAGIAFHLVRLHTTTLSALAGVVTVPRLHYEEVSPGVGQPLGVDHAKTLYGGARVRLLADNAWGLDLSYRYLPDLKVHQGLAGLAIAL